jgi:hypothetical protein
MTGGSGNSLTGQAPSGDVEMGIRRISGVSLAAVLFWFVATVAFSQSEFNEGQGKAVVTVLPQKKGAAPPSIPKDQLTLKLDGKAADITTWHHLTESDAPVQLVVLIDNGARGALGIQLGDISQFLKSLPPSAEAAVAYMENGRANLAGPLSKDHAAVARQLHMPTGPAGISGSPYFCLSDLAHHWPSHDRSARRVVVMITDGVDNYELRYDPGDPYLQAAIHDAVRSRISVYSIYWRSGGEFDRSWYAANDGQNLLAQLTGDTGGFSYWQGVGNPVSLQPYFKDLDRRLQNQFGLSFTAPLHNGPGVEDLSLHANGTSASLVAPRRVYVGHPAAQGQQGSAGE